MTVSIMYTIAIINVNIGYLGWSSTPMKPYCGWTALCVDSIGFSIRCGQIKLACYTSVEEIHLIFIKLLDEQVDMLFYFIAHDPRQF